MGIGTCSTGLEPADAYRLSATVRSSPRRSVFFSSLVSGAETISQAGRLHRISVRGCQLAGDDSGFGEASGVLGPCSDVGPVPDHGGFEGGDWLGKPRGVNRE